ncbi:hypothetical protein LL912_06165 [Niabella sp. CC-SYL272]|uniref:hypothetical protein n=1 Tax=Niabella agricola TaxID=2891571 RepID=UPI001F19CA9B|nr:hypothetical protein [Niabella agricola]MCF3108357.1 hypothetical protein [Niabella agricola]
MIKAYLQICMHIHPADRESATKVYHQYRAPFLQTVKGAVSKELLLHAEGVQVLHGFETYADAQEYLLSDLFNKNVVLALEPCLQQHPDIRIYSVV